jgi:hypothetical protein
MGVEAGEEISGCPETGSFGYVIMDAIEIATRAVGDDQPLCRNRASPRATISAVSSSAFA